MGRHNDETGVQIFSGSPVLSRNCDPLLESQDDRPDHVPKSPRDMGVGTLVISICQSIQRPVSRTGLFVWRNICCIKKM